MCEHVTRTIESKRIAWSEKAIVAFDSLKRRVKENKKLSCSLQVKIDRVAANIVDKVSPKIQSVNDWIDSNGHGPLWRTILTFISKLPLRAARNIVRMLYQIIEGCARLTVHPILTGLDLAKLIVRLLSSPVMPETWAIIGAGMTGSCAGHALVSCNPLVLIGTLIGSVMVAGGLSLTALKHTLLAKDGKKKTTVHKNLCALVKKIPETALTGFLLGVLIGGIQKALAKRQEASTL